MKIVLIASALLLLQAVSPMPRQAANNGTQDGHASKHKSATNEPPPGNVVPPADQKKPSNGEPETAGDAHADENKSINVYVSSPTVSRGVYDFVYIWLTCNLVLVGMGAIIVGLLTLNVIRKQGEIMIQQTAAMEKSAEAAQTTVDSILAENRPWLLIALQETGVSDGAACIFVPKILADGGIWCDFLIKNYGKVPAQKINIWAELTISSDINKPRPLSGDCHLFGDVYSITIVPGGCHAKQRAWREKGLGIAEKELEQLRRKEKWLWIRGLITYRFSIEDSPRPDYRTEFCFRWIGQGDRIEAGDWLIPEIEKYNQAT